MLTLTRALAIAIFAPLFVPAAEYHVSTKGDDRNNGSQATPLRTISAAARLAQPGDVITVHAGTYRERIDPPRGGVSEERRIIYQAAPGDTVWIKGSEVARGWERHHKEAWVLKLPKSYFGAYNPYEDRITGDWFTDKGRPHHTGEVYINGRALRETHLLEEVLEPRPYAEARDQEASTWTWYTRGDETHTYIYANFHGLDPNRELVEINVREAVFYPSRPGRDFITVRGFRMAHAATQWAAPTAEQIGLIGTHWSKGWVIESNEISHSKCACVSLGKERATGHNVWTGNPKKDGATHYNEVILRALEAGWSRERIGGHVVRNNTIFRCEQGGIVGSMGAAFSRITGNHIYDVWTVRQFTGAEMGGIKLHGPIDVLIANNRIHNAGRGLWMDWMTQGTRITANLLYDNTTDDLFVEVNHGPFVVDNNVFLSPLSLRDWSEGGAYAHNFFGGRIESRPVPDRWTPYHRAHSTALAGVTLTHGGDNRFYNNIFVGRAGSHEAGTPSKSSIHGYGPWVYETRKFASFARGNVYLAGARGLKTDAGSLELDNEDPRARLEERGGRVDLVLQLSPRVAGAETVLVTTELLGRTEVAELSYDDVDGARLVIGRDYTGKARNTKKPAPGPFESAPAGELRVRVW